MEGSGWSLAARGPLSGEIIMGEEAMRSNSGRDESRNNLKDPTLRDSADTRAMKARRGAGRTTEMGSGTRKSGPRGADREECAG